MLTYDTKFGDITIADFAKSSLPDLIDVGENNDYWVRVSRRLKQLEIVSKKSGRLVTRCSVDDAESFGFSLALIGAARQAMELGR